MITSVLATKCHLSQSFEQIYNCICSNNNTINTILNDNTVLHGFVQLDAIHVYSFSGLTGK